MNQDEILAKLTTVFRQVFDNDSIVLTPQTSATDIEGWDSFNHVNLIVAAEARFGIKFKTAETEELKNVGDFVKLIEKKCAAGTR